MNTDDHQLIRKFLSKVAQLRYVMIAIDSAISKKLQQYDLATQLPKGQRPGTIQPFEVWGKFGGIDFGLVKGHYPSLNT